MNCFSSWKFKCTKIKGKNVKSRNRNQRFHIYLYLCLSRKTFIGLTMISFPSNLNQCLQIFLAGLMSVCMISLFKTTVRVFLSLVKKKSYSCYPQFSNFLHKETMSAFAPLQKRAETYEKRSHSSSYNYKDKQFDWIR